VNAIFLAIVLLAFAVGAYRQIVWVPATPDAVAPMAALTTAVVDSAGGAVTLAIGLVGMMALFLGLMKVAEAGGLLTIVAKTVRPLMVRAFPDVPANHPAMGAMILNISANALGLGNAATPFGIRAMQALDTLNPHKGTASNAMVLFLAINTSAVTVLPTGVIALRASAGSVDPAGILATTLFATTMSTAAAFIAAKLYQRWSVPAPGASSDEPVVASSEAAAPAASAFTHPDVPTDAAEGAYPTWVSALALAGILGLIPLGVAYGREIGPWVIPGLMVMFLAFGALRGVHVYEVLVDGARDGFQVAIRIIPYLVAILVAVGMFRASGALDILVNVLGPVTSLVGLPAEALPMALLRPLSGQGAYGVLAKMFS
jgi:spore maturation protein SpmA